MRKEVYVSPETIYQPCTNLSLIVNVCRSTVLQGHCSRIKCNCRLAFIPSRGWKHDWRHFSGCHNQKVRIRMTKSVVTIVSANLWHPSTGRYKSLVLFATLIASVAYLLLILRWHGHTNWLESMYILPGGMGTGIAQSAVFIGLQAAIDPAHNAVAITSLYLSTSVGMVAGVVGVSAVLQGMLRNRLESRLDDMGFSEVKKWKVSSILRHMGCC